MCIDCWGHLHSSIEWHATIPYQEWLGKFAYFLRAVIFICFIWTVPVNSSTTIDLARLLVHHWISLSFNCSHDIISLFLLNLIFFFMCVRSGFSFRSSLCKSLFSLPISYTSVTNIDSCFDLFVFHLFCCIFSISKHIVLSFPLCGVHVFCG